MAITVKLRQLKIAERKTRMVADLVRYKTVEEAEAILSFTPKKASLPLLKLLRSAAASAKNTYKFDPKNLYIAKLTVDGGPMQKRVFPRSRGRADHIEKRTSHSTLVLEEANAGRDMKSESIKKEKMSKSK